MNRLIIVLSVLFLTLSCEKEKTDNTVSVQYTNSISVAVKDKILGANLPEVRVALSIKVDYRKEYEYVKTLTTNAQGEVTFENVPAPAFYKVEIAEHPGVYNADEATGRVPVSEDPVEVELLSVSHLGEKEFVFTLEDYLTGDNLTTATIHLKRRFIADAEFMEEVINVTDGTVRLQLRYPAIMSMTFENVQAPYESGAVGDYELTVNNETPTAAKIYFINPEPQYANIGLPATVPATAASVPAGNAYFTSVTTLPITNGIAPQQPRFITGDKYGNVFFTDSHRIVRVDKDGRSHVFAGSTSAGSADGIGTNASFNTPGGLAIDATTNTLYVADTQNNRIRKVTYTFPDFRAEVSTLAGGVSGDAEGSLLSARFSQPQGLALTADGQQLYVADFGNNRVKRVHLAQGQVTNVLGSGASTGEPDLDIQKVMQPLLINLLRPHGVALNYEENRLTVTASRTGPTPNNPYLYNLDIPNNNAYFSAIGFSTPRNRAAGVYVHRDGGIVIADDNGRTITWTRIQALTDAAIIRRLVGFSLSNSNAPTVAVVNANHPNLADVRFATVNDVYYHPYLGKWYVAEGSNTANTNYSAIRVISVPLPL